MKTKKILNPLATLTLLFIMHITVSAQVQWALDSVISTGANSSGIAITPDDSKIVVTNNVSSGTIKVIATSNYAISSISYTADGYPNGVAITPDGSTAVVNTMHQTLYIDLSTNSVSGNFPAPCVGTSLYGIAVNNTSAIYPDLSSGCTQSGLRSINATPPNSGSSFILDNNGGNLYGIALAHDGISAIVTGNSTHGPTKVNLSTSGVQNISGMSQSYGVATLHNTNEALVYDGDSICRVSLTSNTITKKITALTFNSTFQNIAITADDKYAFVVGGFDKKVIDLSNNTVLQTFSSGQTNVATTSNGSRFFVTDSYNGVVRVYKKITSTGIDDFKKAAFNISIYPNPTSDKIMISSSEKIVTIEIYNLIGERVCSMDSGQLKMNNAQLFPSINSALSIDLSSQPKGIYFLQATDENKNVTNKKIVIE